jgi:hypothetical protein
MLTSILTMQEPKTQKFPPLQEVFALLGAAGGFG